MARYVNKFFFFFFNDTATTEIYTLSLHDALPISSSMMIPVDRASSSSAGSKCESAEGRACSATTDRKSTRLNSSHSQISYAVFCLKKKKQDTVRQRQKSSPADLARRALHRLQPTL